MNLLNILRLKPKKSKAPSEQYKANPWNPYDHYHTYDQTGNTDPSPSQPARKTVRTATNAQRGGRSALTASKDGTKYENDLKRAAPVGKKTQKQNPSTPSVSHVRRNPKHGVPEASNARVADGVKPSIKQGKWSPVRKCNVCDFDIIIVPPARPQSYSKSKFAITNLRTSKPESKSKSTIAYPRIQKCGREYFGMECKGSIEVSAQDDEKARLVPPEEIKHMQRWNYNYGERFDDRL